MEKEKEVVRENRSLRTVWKQCFQSPWVCQTQKSKESEIGNGEFQGDECRPKACHPGGLGLA